MQLNGNGYPQTRTNGEKKFLHHIVMNTTQIIDHINGNKLDNRRPNLRLADASLNNLNKHSSSRNTSGVIGVSWSSRDQK